MAPLPDAGRNPSRRRRRWLILTFGLFVCFGSWSVASPLMAPPDEAAHLYKAAAVVRGELFGKPEAALPDGRPNPNILVKVPAGFYDAWTLWSCYTYHLNQPASCAPSLHGPSNTKSVTVATYVGRYPPLYYLIVGLPSLVFPSTFGVYLMRLLSALLSALFLASAFESTLELAGSSLLVLGVAVAATPMVFYLGGTINPNGLEISSALCAWVSGLALVLDERPDVVDRRVLARAGLAAAVLVQIRALSPLWLALIFAVLLAVATTRRLAVLIRDPAVWLWSGLVGACSGFALWWIFHYHSLAIMPGQTYPAPSSTSAPHLIATALGFVDTEVRGMIGLLGRPDTPAPSLTIYLWLATVAVMVGLAFVLGRRRIALVVAAAIMVVIVVPTVLDAAEATKFGFVWQGRYTLPFAVGIPVMAAVAVRRSLPAVLLRRLRFLIPAGLALAQVALFLWGVWRYGVGESQGYSGSLNPFGGTWQPPLGSLATFAIFLVGLSVYSFWVATNVGRDDQPLRRPLKDEQVVQAELETLPVTESQRL